MLRVILFLFIAMAVDAFAGPGGLQSELESHDRAVNVMSYEWMRDPYIYVHGDGYFYLMETRLEEIAWGTQGIELWRSDNLTNWESIGVSCNFDNSSWLARLVEDAVINRLELLRSKRVITGVGPR